MKFFMLVTTVAFAAAAPAAAEQRRYTLSGLDTDGTVEFASFRIDANPVVLPQNVGPGEGFRIKRLTGVFQYGTIVSHLQDISFQNAALDGGFFNLDPRDKIGYSSFLITVGPQLYSGPEASPTLLAGSFTVYDYFSNAPLSLTVEAAPGTVPEPATWGMLTAGMAIVGGGLRRNRRPAGGTAAVAS